MMLLFLIILAFASSTGNRNLDYTILENLGVSCPMRDQCRSQAIDSNFFDRSCECDHRCREFEDCCIDVPGIVPSGKSNVMIDRITKPSCMAYGFKQNLGAYVTDTCSNMYMGSESVRQRCEDYDVMDDSLLTPPVTEMATGNTYRNRYCADCNGASSTDLKSWLIYMDCMDPAGLGVDASYVWQNVKYQLDLYDWVVEHDGKSRTCYFTFEKPDYLDSEVVRPCRPDLISTCPYDWSDNYVRNLCSWYMAVVYDDTGVAFRNPHCAMCNRRLDKTACVRDDTSFRGQMEFSDRDQFGKLIRKECGPDRIYDPYFKKCRPLVCGIPGYKKQGSRCVKKG